MNEEPKSIWKKSWKGTGSFLGWLVLITGLAFVVSLLGVIILDPRQWRADCGIVIAGTAGGAIVGLLFLFIRWIFCWCNVRQLLFGAACVATLIALFYAEEDWRGWHAWNQYRHEWEARGEHFDFASVVPPPVPDDQNFALTPIVFTSYGQILTRDGKQIPHEQRDTNFVGRIKMEIAHDDDWPTNGIGNWQKSTAGDLSVWQNYYWARAAKTNEFSVPAEPQSPAADVLLALSKYDPVIEELWEASRLPYSRFPLNYDSESPGAILLPHLVALKRCSRVLQLRSIAELQNAQPEKALADVKLGLQLTDKIHTEPFLISHLVRIAMMQVMLQPVYEGLAEHKWSDAQLVELDSELAKLDFPADYKLAMRGELGCQGGEMDRLRRHPQQSGFFDDEGYGSNLSIPGGLVARLMPAGWFYQNQYNCARMMVAGYIPLADVNQQIISPAAVWHADEVLRAETKKTTPYNILEKMLLPAFGNSAKKFACAQGSVNLARTAIALERYRLARGEFPETLDVLAPQFIAKLPHDIINGQPLHYRLNASGQFVLYSVGWNETDDGGVVGFKITGRNSNGQPILDFSEGDWVWRYPGK